MHRLWILLLVAFVGQAQAQGRDIETTIGAQIEAFRADDYAKAFTYASPAIQQLFGGPDNFGAMVRHGFPMVRRPERLQFLELRKSDGRMWQKVMITDATGQVHLLDYQMIDVDSGWKINGVQILDPPGTSV